MPFVICAVPWFNEVATDLLAAIVALPDVRLGVLSQAPLEELAPQVRAGVVAHRRVGDLRDAGKIAAAARELADRHGPIHRLFGPQEQLQAPLAEARERLGVAGMGVEAARNFRDKARMKERFRAAGLPCARHRLAASEAEAWRFAEEAGYPLVVKPPAGAAAQATFRAGTPDELRAALATAPPAPGREVLLEEFITGEEHSFDTFSLDGRHVWHSLTRYLPPPLEVLRTPWIQWRVVLPREVDAPAYDDIRAMAYRALDALGMDTGLSHLEWFRRGDGSLAISEVAARPPGAQITKLMSLAHDFDCTAAWARLMIHGAFDPPARRYAAGAAYLRGQGTGRVVAIHGWEQARRELGALLAEAKLPALGQAASGGYEGEGYVLLRHPDTAVVTEALLRLITTVRVELG
ncbi:MAG TPA: ATP-grasp domain-containing protein [Thermomicrobiales bacterium]|nr:ATP-grasp domain-containing protein [Thermomicrobiales bacterium]